MDTTMPDDESVDATAMPEPLHVQTSVPADGHPDTDGPISPEEREAFYESIFKKSVEQGVEPDLRGEQLLEENDDVG